MPAVKTVKPTPTGFTEITLLQLSNDSIFSSARSSTLRRFLILISFILWKANLGTGTRSELLCNYDDVASN